MDNSNRDTSYDVVSLVGLYCVALYACLPKRWYDHRTYVRLWLAVDNVKTKMPMYHVECTSTMTIRTSAWNEIRWRRGLCRSQASTATSIAAAGAATLVDESDSSTAAAVIAATSSAATLVVATSSSFFFASTINWMRLASGTS